MIIFLQKMYLREWLFKEAKKHIDLFCFHFRVLFRKIFEMISLN